MSNHLPADNGDGWDMSARREHAVMSAHAGVSEDDAEALLEESNIRLPTSRGVLSKAEIAALLRPDLDDMPDAPPVPESVDQKAVPEFGAPAADAGEATDTDMQEARRLAARLSLALRRDCGLKSAAAVNAVRREEFALALEGAGRGVAVACFAGPSGEIAAMLVLSAPLTSALIETACGGQPSAPEAVARALTPLDAALLEGLVRPLGNAISGTLSFARVETDAAFAAALAAPGPATVIDLDVRVDHLRLPATLVLAENALPEAVLRAPDDKGLFAAPDPLDAPPSPAPQPAALTAVLTARIASISVPLSRLSDLKAGSTLLLGVPSDQPVALLSGGRDGTLAAEGEIGRKGGKMAVRVTRRGPALKA